MNPHSYPPWILLTLWVVARPVRTAYRTRSAHSRLEPSLISALDSPNSLGCCPSCPNGISDTLRPLPSEWAYTNSGRQANPALT
nr:MAG TPA: hypothetical protein [Caudoviricetes sp.]